MDRLLTAKKRTLEQPHAPETHLREPAREVVHDDSGDERLAEAGGQADERVRQQGSLDHVQLILALWDSFRVDPVPSVDPAASTLGHALALRLRQTAHEGQPTAEQRAVMTSEGSKGNLRGLIGSTFCMTACT